MPASVSQVVAPNSSAENTITATVPQCPSHDWRVAFTAETLTFTNGESVKMP
jgi:hypothetical protein